MVGMVKALSFLSLTLSRYAQSIEKQISHVLNVCHGFIPYILEVRERKHFLFNDSSYFFKMMNVKIMMRDMKSKERNSLIDHSDVSVF